MIEIDITDSVLFDSLLEISYGKSSYYDLHNDYDLKLINFEKSNSLLEIEFEGIDKKSLLHLTFKGVEIIEFIIPFESKGLTIDNFHRGRFEYEKELYDEFNSKKCFYMEFYEKGKLNLLCSKAILKAETYNKVISLKK